MDILDRFLQRYSYKFPGGVPDLTQIEDQLLLESILEEMEIDTSKNIGYRVGNVDIASESLESRNWYFGSKIGYLGTGFYFFGTLEMAEKHSKSAITKKSTGSTIYQIDLDQYKLFKPSNPDLFYDYIKEITHGVGNLSTEEIESLELKDSIDEIVGVIQNELNIKVSDDKILEILKQFVSDIETKSKGKLLTNRLLEPLGYEGIDNRGSSLDGFGVGSLVFEIKPNTVTNE